VLSAEQLVSKKSFLALDKQKKKISGLFFHHRSRTDGQGPFTRVHLTFPPSSPPQKKEEDISAAAMGKIIFCDDLILRVDDKEDLTNVTEWLLESTEYRPATPESCTVRSVSHHKKQNTGSGLPDGLLSNQK
jgi:hypothetical protein